MTSQETNELRDPDLFSAELHHCLLTQGLRSQRLRGLMRLARSHAELERIFETKVSEFRRYLRETRVPTVWNLPVRASEWLGDNARFTPTREVLTTLAYVAFVLFGVDFAKSQIASYQAKSTPGRQLLAGALRPSYEFESELTRPSTASMPDAHSKVDEWLATELKRAADSTDWDQVLTQRLQACLEKMPLDEILLRRVEQMGQSSAQRKIVNEQSPSEIEPATVGAATQPAESLQSAALVQKTDALVATSDEQKLKSTTTPSSDKPPVVEAVTEVAPAGATP